MHLKNLLSLLVIFTLLAYASETDKAIIENLDFYMNMELIETDFVDNQESITDEQFNANMEALND